ncbi:hypothetical protein [Devosia sp.]|uniref:alcohol dehydrogenase catalytic domain-containing protein n=1 Tax=Devosia sp. TaxID=1871048 RepID=UPI0025E24A45|nr:hypothetical protein [Devosia sp.]MCR6637081.1 hypothetical protein [Devosia sp.]
MTEQITLPPTMSAIHIATPGAPDALQVTSLPLPEVKPGEVLIRVAAAGVNGPDLAQRRGHYDPPPGASPCPVSKSQVWLSLRARAAIATASAPASWR